MKKHLEAFDVLTDAEIENFLELATKRRLEKTDYFIKEGETCKEVAFIVSGILRSYYTSEKGEEISYCITFPNNLMTAYSSFITGQSSVESIQAITPVVMLVIQKKQINDLTATSPNWVKFLKIVAEQQYIALEKRVFQLQSVSTLQRYTELANNHPEYIQNIPLQYLATYLGTTQRHLSRIRKEFAKRTNVL